MTFTESFKSELFQINEENFDSYAIKVYLFQFENNPIYHDFARSLGKTPEFVNTAADIPFLPIDFWKTHAVKSEDWEAEKLFLSSGTTQTNRSKSYVKSLDFYEQVFSKIFLNRFESLATIEILALLPSYQEQGNSSLIYMIDKLISKAHPKSTYYNKDNFSELATRLTNTDHPKILFGVSFALLDLIEYSNLPCKNTVIIETGGMKGRRKEIIREDLHSRLKSQMDTQMVYSEYGMSEMMSQAYTNEEGNFTLPSWMKVIIRDVNDPFTYLPSNQTGGINIIDLANIHTCSFIETKDLGKQQPDGTFQVLGRFDNSDIRGCNLLIQ